MLGQPRRQARHRAGWAVQVCVRGRAALVRGVGRGGAGRLLGKRQRRTAAGPTRSHDVGLVRPRSHVRDQGDATCPCPTRPQCPLAHTGMARKSVVPRKPRSPHDLHAQGQDEPATTLPLQPGHASVFRCPSLSFPAGSVAAARVLPRTCVLALVPARASGSCDNHMLVRVKPACMPALLRRCCLLYS